MKYVKRRNFSGYVKKLILADIKNNQKVDTDPEIKEFASPKKLTVAEKLELKKKEMKKQAATSRPFIKKY